MAEVIEAEGLTLAYGLVPWDTEACGFPVAEISALQFGPLSPSCDGSAWPRFEQWRDGERVGLVSCRLAADRVRESHWLEAAGFRFVEMVLRPTILLESARAMEDPGLEIALADAGDVPVLADIAGRAFVTDRFTVDPRIGRGVSGNRYRRWVESVPGHKDQRLHCIREAGEPVAFFITEMRGDGTCHWHLTAVEPALHGRGYGKRIWKAMMARGRSEGAQRIVTTISVRNIPVLNLYGGLGFRLASPAFTFHWVRR